MHMCSLNNAGGIINFSGDLKTYDNNWDIARGQVNH